MGDDEDDHPRRVEEDAGTKFSPPLFKWAGEKERFLIWHKLVTNACLMKGGLVKRIVCHGLTLTAYLREQGGNAENQRNATDKYERANSWVYQLVGKPLLEAPGSTAYSLYNSHRAGEGVEILNDFLTFFAGKTEEEIEDIEDEWKQLNFSSDGVVLPG